MTKKDYDAVLNEDLRDQNKRTLEALASLAGLPAKVDGLIADMDEVKTDVKTIKMVVTHQSRTLKNNEQRIIQLEAA